MEIFNIDTKNENHRANIFGAIMFIRKQSIDQKNKIFYKNSN
jgi:hypothetical protein